MKVGDKVFYRNKDATVTRTDGVGLGMCELYITDSTGAYLVIAESCDLMYAALPELSSFFEKETTAKPTRYSKNGTLEVWDAISQLGLDYKQGNILKYIYRYKDKHGAQDLKKAMNYLAKMLSEETGEDYYELRKKSLDEL